MALHNTYACIYTLHKMASSERDLFFKPTFHLVYSKNMQKKPDKKVSRARLEPGYSMPPYVEVLTIAIAASCQCSEF